MSKPHIVLRGQSLHGLKYPAPTCFDVTQLLSSLQSDKVVKKISLKKRKRTIRSVF